MKCCFIMLWVGVLLGSSADASTVFESDGSTMGGWVTQWHQTSDADTVAPVWRSDGSTLQGAPLYSEFLADDFGGTMFHTNSFSMKVGEVATLTMDFEGQGITAPDNLNHWWFSFGFRTGGEEPWLEGDLAAYVSFRAGAGPGLPNGFEAWNAWEDSWTEPYPRCEIRSGADYRSDKLTITYWVERTEEGFGPTSLMVSNHVTGVRTMATSLHNPVNENSVAASNLYFFCQMPARYDWEAGSSCVGTRVELSHIKLEVGSKALQSSYMASLTKQGPPVQLPAQQIKSIKEIKLLSNIAAAKQYPAKVQGQVISLHPKQSRVFIHDGTAGMYVELKEPVEKYDGLRVGSEVEFEGVTLSGGYSPIVYSAKLKVVGWKPLPHARRLDHALYRSTSIDVDWVSAEGRPISMEYVKSYNHYLITMEVLDTIVDVFVPYTPGAYRKMKPFMFNQVRVQGVLGTTANHHQQMTGRMLYINSIDDFRLAPDISGIVPRHFPIQELMQYGKASTGLVKTFGTVVSATENTLFLRGEQATLKASIFQEQQFNPGDQVELVGYVDIQPIGPAFRTVSIVKTGEEAPPRPRQVRLFAQEIDPGWNYELVSLEADFVYAEKSLIKRRIHASDNQNAVRTKEILWCRVGSRLFEARMPDGVAAPAGMRPGSRIRLTGICHVLKTKNPRLEKMTDSLWLQLTDKSSIGIIRRASWWTAERLFGVLLILSVLALFFLVWVIALRKIVARQTETIGAQVQRETTLNERQRIAQELHDTLEQGLTALMLQLKRIHRKCHGSEPADLETVEKAMSTLQVCRNESRATIQDLRGGLLEEMNLPEAIRYTLLPRLEETGIQLSVEVEGNPIRLTMFAEHQILRLVTEASSNAVQHASPKTIHICLGYLSDRLTVSILDDGSGFDPDLIQNSGRFGVKGMHERANRLYGELSIESHAGEGTSVTLSMPVQEFINEESL